MEENAASATASPENDVVEKDPEKAPDKKKVFTRRSLIASFACTGVLALVAGSLTIFSEMDPAAGEGGNSSVLPLKEGKEAASDNSALLQNAIDEASGGAGVVSIGEGEFYFAFTDESSDGNYVIEMRDGVEVHGAGIDKTILKPLGRYAMTGEAPHGIDMFYYDGLEDGRYLKSATFRDFTIDGESTQGSLRGYNASGKGFFFKLFQDCLWENICVRNTDGTGFGADFPINCTMRNCIAVGCGKNATSSSVGASGFGVGVGYSEDESMLIEDCSSSCNTKFGFFFEHQSLFGTDGMTAKRAEGFRVAGCKAWGNLINFGGNRAYDVVYRGCESDVSSDSYTDRYTDYAFRFVDHSVRIVVEQAVVDQMYSDIEDSSASRTMEWALSNNVAHVGSNDNDTFRPTDKVTRAEVAVFLWRYAGRPGDVVLGDASLDAPATDVTTDDYCADAVRWLKADGFSSGAKFRADDTITLGEFALLLWRYAALLSNEGSQASYALRLSREAASTWEIPRAASEKEEQQTALSWVKSEGIMDVADAAAARSACTRIEAMDALYAFDDARRTALGE